MAQFHARSLHTIKSTDSDGGGSGDCEDMQCSRCGWHQCVRVRTCKRTEYDKLYFVNVQGCFSPPYVWRKLNKFGQIYMYAAHRTTAHEIKQQRTSRTEQTHRGKRKYSPPVDRQQQSLQRQNCWVSTVYSCPNNANLHNKLLDILLFAACKWMSKSVGLTYSSREMETKHFEDANIITCETPVNTNLQHYCWL